MTVHLARKLCIMCSCVDYQKLIMTKSICGLLDISYLNLTLPPYCIRLLFVFYNYDMLTVAVTALKDKAI